MATLDESFHAHIFAYFWCSQFGNSARPIHLLVDTGCSTTTILSDDVTRLGINCAGLNQATRPTSTANGLVLPYIMPNVKFVMEFYHGWFNHANDLIGVDMSEVHCHPPTNPQQMTRLRILGAYSLLGMDFLRYFKKWKFSNGFLYIDT
ncbi:MAG: aspartyl protease family protein [Candidatus Bathyarchaeia archaeon]